MDQIQALRQTLQTTTDINGVKRISTDLKKIIFKLGLYKITTKDLQQSNPDINSLIAKLHAVRDALEDVTFSLARFGDLELFERNYNQIRPYYTDFKHILQPSENTLGIIALYLLSLLTTVPSRLSDFHCQVEYLSPEDLKHPHVATILKLEEALMEGAYSRVLVLRGELDAIPHSQHFTAQLESIVVGNILSVVQSSSSTYPLDKLCQLLSLQQARVEELIATQGWSIVDGVVLINDTAADDEEYSTKHFISELIDTSLSLDKIV